MMESYWDLYQAAFSYREKSGEATEMVASRIMGFRSNRAQDYRMALWQLGEYHGSSNSILHEPWRPCSTP